MKKAQIARTEGCILYYNDLYKKTPSKDILKTLEGLNEYLLDLKAPVVKKKVKNEIKP